MPVSVEYKVIFVHIPKNAGSSIEEALAIKASEASLYSKAYTGRFIYAMQHLPLRELKAAVTAAQWESFAKVAVVRNPWDRLVSDWYWRRKGGLALGELAFPAFAQLACEMVGGGKGWDRRIDSRRFKEEYLGHFQRQVAYTGHDAAGHDGRGGGSGGSGVRILRFESLSRDWDRFAAEALGRTLPLPYTNDSGRTAGRHYSEEYDDALAAVVGRAYAADAEAFGYSFERPSARRGGGSGGGGAATKDRAGFKDLLGGFMKKKKPIGSRKNSAPAKGASAPPPGLPVNKGSAESPAAEPEALQPDSGPASAKMSLSSSPLSPLPNLPVKRPRSPSSEKPLKGQVS